MPTLESHQSSSLVKMLIMGNSGSGKTGSLASLARAGYRLFICDFDNGLDILLDPAVLPPEFRKNIYYKPFQDSPKTTGSSLIRVATAWQDFQRSLGGWKEGTESLGNFTTWGEKDVLVVDSLTFASDRAFDDALQLGGRLGQRAQIQDYGLAIDNLQSLLEMLYSSACKCNVVMTSHIQFGGDELSGLRKGYPNVIGQKLAPKIPRLFNNMILIEKKVIGNTVTREFVTNAHLTLDLKTSKPSVIPNRMPADLAQLFAYLKGESAPAVPAQTSTKA